MQRCERASGFSRCFKHVDQLGTYHGIWFPENRVADIQKGRNRKQELSTQGLGRTNRIPKTSNQNAILQHGVDLFSSFVNGRRAVRCILDPSRCALAGSKIQAHSMEKRQIGFFTLPREIRDQIYAECLLAPADVIPLSNLREDASLRPSSQKLGLVPSILRSCRQIYQEAVTMLYSENFFFADLVTPWTYTRPLRWRQCFQLAPEDLLLCLKCEQEQESSLSSLSSDNLAWAANTKLVRRLQVSIRPYSFLQWRLRQRSAFPNQLARCTHTLATAIPPNMTLGVLVVRILKRSLLYQDECIPRDNWFAIGFGYQGPDSVEWRRHATKDTSRNARALFAWGGRIAKVAILAGPDFVPYMFPPTIESPPRWMTRLLHSGKILDGSVQSELPCLESKHIGFVMRGHFERIALANDELVVDITGPELARRSFKPTP